MKSHLTDHRGERIIDYDLSSLGTATQPDFL